MSVDGAWAIGQGAALAGGRRRHHPLTAAHRIIRDAREAYKVDDFLHRIDWRELRDQKTWLAPFEGDDEPEATGLLSLLDALQDLAVDDYGFSARLVFGADAEDERDGTQFGDWDDERNRDAEDELRTSNREELGGR